MINSWQGVWLLKPRVLIADPDMDFISSLQDQGSQVEITTAHDQKSAQLAIANISTQFSAMCLNVNLCSPMALPLVRFVKFHRPSSPLYLMSDSAPTPLDKEELDSLHITEVIYKPIAPSALMQVLIPSGYFNMADALEVSKTDATKVGDSNEIDDGKMHGIEAGSFLCGKKSFFDLYVKVSSGKFLMILKAGDQFEPERLANYIRKGTKSFYIKREAQHFYLQYCDKLTASFLGSERISLKEKTSQLANLGHETGQYLLNMGLSQITLNAAQSFVNHANTLIRKTELKKSNEVQAFLADIMLADHGTSTVMITSMMIKELGFRDEKVTNLIATGAMLHDIGLLSLPEAIRAKADDESQLTDEERTLYETHPQLGHDLLVKVPHINALIPQIALQHHERRTRKGFPNKLGSGAISTVSEMIGLADVFLSMAKTTKAGDLPVLERVKKECADEFSLKVIDGFMKAFTNK
jgi:HD-GYP domain-containing protein (c-di-GMP phosphodiesterase class II)